MQTGSGLATQFITAPVIFTLAREPYLDIYIYIYPGKNFQDIRPVPTADGIDVINFLVFTSEPEPDIGIRP